MNLPRLPAVLRLKALLPVNPVARGRGVGRIVELLVFALAVPLVGRALFPTDPLGIDGGFPWAAIGPVVFAARYGLAAGLACALLAALAFMLPSAAYAGRGADVVALAIGTALLTLLIGDSASAWRRRSLRAEAENVYLRHRLKEFSNDYHVLKVSHGQLEEFLAGQRLSLREALEQIRPSHGQGGSDALGGGEALMAVFAHFCSVQVAGLYVMKSDTLIDPVPVALHGGMGELPMFDPLLRLALAERRLVSVRHESAASNQHAAGLLAVVPIVDSRDRLHGLLAVRDMHFMAFQQRNLDTLALLAGYVADLIARSGGLGDAPAERFVAELDTALRFVRTHAVDSSLVRLRIAPHTQRDEIVAFLAEGIRSLDCAWVPTARVRDSVTLAVLLPLVGEPGAGAWLARASAAVERRFGVALAPLLVSSSILPLERIHTRRECLLFLGTDEAADGSVGEIGRALSPDGDDRRIDHVA